MQPQVNHPVSVAAGYRSGGAPASTLAALVDAHASERRLLDELVTIMQRQRSAVAADDLQGVDDSVFATHRILVTLGEARRRRRSLNTIVGGADELDAQSLADAFGGEIPPALREAREALRASAAALAREVDVNRRVLREAIATGDDYMRKLVSSATGETPRAEYGPGATQPAEQRSGGLLLDRRV
ncbi:MAG TPA: flagellar export chaperone FlgN [Gemmatimonadales bacterium]